MTNIHEIHDFKAEFIELIDGDAAGLPVVPSTARVVEVGAGAGAVTVALAHRARHVHTYEPITEMRCLVLQRLADRSITNVTMHSGAVGPPGCRPHVRLHQMREPWNSGKHIPFYDTPAAHVTVPQTPLDEALRHADADMLVLDCEGGECELLPPTDLSRLSTLVVEWHPHIVGDGPVEAAHRHLTGPAGFRRVQRVVGELRPGGFAEVAVYRR